MNDKNLSFSSGKAGLVLGVVLLGALTGCVAYVDRPAQGSVYVSPAYENTTVVVVDDYVYYPSYECYYSVSRHQYAYREGNVWVARPAPRGVTVNVLLASPSVRMNFHDAPERHHAAVVQQYPKNWKPSAEKQGQPDKRNRKDDPRDQHEDNHGR
jgi:hypothetical protein